MPARGRRRRPGLMREDAARDAMKRLTFEEPLINEAIKELLEVYGEEGWTLIEEDSYFVLLNLCMEKSVQQEAARKEQEEAAQEEQQEEEEQDQQVEDGRDQVGSNSTFPVGSGAETGTPQPCLTDAASITSEAGNDSSPAMFQSGDYAPHSAGESSHCEWLSSEEEESDPDDDDDDDEMIQLTPEPLSEELEEFLRNVRGEKRKRVSRWDT